MLINCEKACGVCTPITNSPSTENYLSSSGSTQQMNTHNIETTASTDADSRIPQTVSGMESKSTVISDISSTITMQTRLQSTETVQPSETPPVQSSGPPRSSLSSTAPSNAESPASDSSLLHTTSTSTEDTGERKCMIVVMIPSVIIL